MSLAVNSHDQVFAAVLAGGVYRSIDNGDSWQAVNNGLETQRYIALIIDAKDVIYAANENGDVFSSEDNGETWLKLEVKNPIGEAAAELVMDNENQLYFGAVEKGIFRYSEKEKNWIQLNNGLENTTIRSLIFINSDSIFAGTSGAEDYKNFHGQDVYRSSDKGKNWTLEKSGLNHPRIKALATNSKGFLFAGTWGGGVYKSIFPVK
jgi:ligand-binding sensor domain-containing protein